MRRTPNTPYPSHEYDRLKDRGFKPYSRGHRKMYLTPIERLAAAGQRVHVFEAGFGIGYGVEEMVKAGVVASFTGCEPDEASFHYVRNIVAPGLGAKIELLNEPFSLTTCAGRQFDVAFCVEVIEHIPMADHLDFLTRLGRMAPRLFFSTPDKRFSKEGVRSLPEWLDLLAVAGFPKVIPDLSNWTYLYDCFRSP